MVWQQIERGVLGKRFRVAWIDVLIVFEKDVRSLIVDFITVASEERIGSVRMGN